MNRVITVVMVLLTVAVIGVFGYIGYDMKGKPEPAGSVSVLPTLNPGVDYFGSVQKTVKSAPDPVVPTIHGGLSVVQGVSQERSETVSTPETVPIEYGFDFPSPPQGGYETADVTFSWLVRGTGTIKTTGIRYGSESVPGILARDQSPAQSKYPEMTPDFADGSFALPLWFNVRKRFSPGTYYYRLYAEINGQHYWSDEYSLAIWAEPKHTVTIVTPREEIYKGDTMTFTWEVAGPAATATTTVIMAGRESHPGDLGTGTAPQDTPYTVLVGEFASGNYAVPLRFIGNKRLDETGKFYYRAYAYLNGKNYWSEEKWFEVK